VAYHVEKHGLFGVDGLVGEFIIMDDDFVEDDEIEIPLSGVQGDRFSSLA